MEEQFLTIMFQLNLFIFSDNMSLKINFLFVENPIQVRYIAHISGPDIFPIILTIITNMLTIT